MGALGRALLMVGVILLVSGQSPVDASAAYDVLLSTSPDRSTPVPLAGQTVFEDIYVFIGSDVNVARVAFFIDDAQMSSSPESVDRNTPFDLAGTAQNGTANAYDTSQLVDGSHDLTAKLLLSDGTSQVVSSSFIVDNGGGGEPSDPTLQFTPAVLDFGFEPGADEAKAQTAILDNSTGTTVSFTITEDADWLTVSPSSGQTPSNIVISADPSGLTSGSYSASVTAESTGALSADLSVTVNVLPTFDQVHLAWVEDPSTTLTVVWRTASTVDPSLLRYRPSGVANWSSAEGILRPSGTAGALHEVTLRSLDPSTSYDYQLLLPDGSWSESFVTRTAPGPGPADFEAVFFADTGIKGRTDGLTTGTEQIIDEMAGSTALVALAAGDFAYANTEDRYASLDEAIDAWFNQMQPLASRVPMMPAYGNHEIKLGEGYAPWSARFPTPEGVDGRRNYSFDVGDVHFISIMAVEEKKGVRPNVIAWIEDDIEAALASGQRWIIPYFHVAPFSDGMNHPSNVALRSQLGPLFERLGVKLVLTAHDQSYERTYPLVDVPNSNTPTSSSSSCYTLEDGVTWAKISPGGKLSNQNVGFSQWRTSPPPAWTAYRDNSFHHYSKLVVSTAGVIRLETFGVVGDGTTPTLIDSFEYRDGGCP